jgi:hypothetical protein
MGCASLAVTGLSFFADPAVSWQKMLQMDALAIKNCMSVQMQSYGYFLLLALFPWSFGDNDDTGTPALCLPFCPSSSSRATHGTSCRSDCCCSL